MVQQRHQQQVQAVLARRVEATQATVVATVATPARQALVAVVARAVQTASVKTAGLPGHQDLAAAALQTTDRLATMDRQVQAALVATGAAARAAAQSAVARQHLAPAAVAVVQTVTLR